MPRVWDEAMETEALRSRDLQSLQVEMGAVRLWAVLRCT